MMTTQSSPIVTEMKVIPVAGQDSMLLNIGGAHNAWFTRNIVVLTDSAGNTGVGEAPGGEVIYQTLVDAIPQVVGQEIARLNKVVQRVHKGNQSADFDTFGKGAWTFELRVNAVAALEAALLDLLGKALNVPVCELLGPGKQRNAVTGLSVLRWRPDENRSAVSGTLAGQPRVVSPASSGGALWRGCGTPCRGGAGSLRLQRLQAERRRSARRAGD